MFNNKNDKKSAQRNLKDDSSINLIGTGTEIEGTIYASGDIRIDGVLKGDIESESKVVIGKSGKVKGNIDCQNADILGRVDDGKIKVQEVLSLKETARIKGEITTSKLIIESGAEFNGDCHMGKQAKSSDDDDEKQSGKGKGKLKVEGG